jgi:hypothetical protein
VGSHVDDEIVRFRTGGETLPLAVGPLLVVARPGTQIAPALPGAFRHQIFRGQTSV